VCSCFPTTMSSSSCQRVRPVSTAILRPPQTFENAKDQQQFQDVFNVLAVSLKPVLPTEVCWIIAECSIGDVRNCDNCDAEVFITNEILGDEDRNVLFYDNKIDGSMIVLCDESECMKGTTKCRYSGGDDLRCNNRDITRLMYLCYGIDCSVPSDNMGYIDINGRLYHAHACRGHSPDVILDRCVLNGSEACKCQQHKSNFMMIECLGRGRRCEQCRGSACVVSLCEIRPWILQVCPRCRTWGW